MTVAIPDPTGNQEKPYLELGTPEHLHTAWRILAGGAPKAAAALVDVAVNGSVPGARVAAAKTILEMTGFKSPDVVPVLPPEHDQATSSTLAGDSPAARIRNRLAAFTALPPEPSRMPDLEDLVPEQPDVIDAEVVEGGQG